MGEADVRRLGLLAGHRQQRAAPGLAASLVAGRLANLSPEQTSLNKPLYGVVGTQKSGVPGTGQQSAYASNDLSVLFQNGLDVIANPQPGGAYFGVRGGFNTSSSAAMNGDNYTRLTDYIAATLQAGMGIYVGQVVNAQLFLNIKATLLNFLSGMLSQGLLGSTDGSLPFSVVCDTTTTRRPARRWAMCRRMCRSSIRRSMRNSSSMSRAGRR